MKILFVEGSTSSNCITLTIKNEYSVASHPPTSLRQGVSKYLGPWKLEHRGGSITGNFKKVPSITLFSVFSLALLVCFLRIHPIKTFTVHNEVEYRLTGLTVTYRNGPCAPQRDTGPSVFVVTTT